MYYLVFFILFWFSVVEVFFKKKNPLWFNISYIIMTFMAMFRYGQLADYFNYKDLYEGRNSMEEGRDPLFYLFEDFCINLGLDFEIFVIIIGAISMIVIYPFFVKHCQKSITALLVFYSYIFLILPMTAMRQGLCVSLLLWNYSFLIEGKMWRFYVTLLIGCFIHLSMLVAILIPLLYRKTWYNSNLMVFVIIGMTMVALITPDLSHYTMVFGNRAFEADAGSRILQVSIRALLIIPVLLIKPEYKTNGYYAKAICIIGYCVYCLMSFSVLVSARLEFFFRVFMCLLVSFALFSMERTRIFRLLMSSILVIHVFLFFKNMDAAIEQGDYNKDKVSMFSFPYISIFDKDELNQYK